MKKTLLFLLALCCFAGVVNAQVTAKDCTAAVNVCTNNSFSVSPAGAGFVDFTTASTISNPTGNPAGVVPTGGAGCLKAGELNPTWMIINIQTPGTLEFSMGAGTGVGAQSGCYDWIMWPYNATTCSGINANTQAPVRCCWNSFCSGGTGLASSANLPAGGHSQDYGAPLNVNCGDKYIICFSNYSSVSTLVPLNFFGTAVVSCSPLSSTLSINSPTICAGSVATLSVPSSPGTTYTWQPGNVSGNTMTVSPATTTIYTLNATNACGTLSGTTAVIVSSPMNITFSNTNGSCSPASFGSSTVTVTGGVPAYSYSWSPTGGTSSSASNLTTNIYSMTVTDAIGCKSTATTSIIAPAPLSFSLNPLGSTVLGCIQNSVAVNAVNTSTLSNVTYTWNPGSLTGTTATLTAPGVYTVNGMDLTVGSCLATQTIAVTQNTAVPGCTVSPTSRTLTCGSPCASFTATSSGTTNIVGVWMDQSNAVISGPSSTPLVMCTSNTGTYTAVFTNSVNGCTSSQTVSVVDNSGSVPSMSVTSNQNTFTLTCTYPQISMNINTTSTITPKTYSWTNVSTNVTTTPVSGGYTVTVPGQYIACLNANNCVVCQTITISQDTVRPIVSSITSLPSSSYTLTCTHPVLTASAVTSPMLPLSSYSWTTPPNLTISQPTISVSLSNITSSTSPTAYTVLAMGANGCVGRQKVLISKDIFVPPYTAVITPSAITCANQCIAMSTGASTSTVPVTFTFTSPAPTMTANTNGFLFCQPGTYTMTYQSTLNGCTATTTTLVPLNVTPPATVALSTATINCGAPTTTLTAGTTTTSSTYSYTWAGPLNAGMSCPGGVGCYSTTTNMPGNYFVTIVNTVNGCRSYNSVNVVGGSLEVGLTANPTSGFAPLNVSFANNTPSTSTQGTVTTVWSYGNGLTASTTSAATAYSGSQYPFPVGSTIYNSAGTYTVLLMVTQVSATTTCSGTATTVVTVDLPSALTIPNVFTPNNDGVNDYFTLQTTSVSEITCTIFDRWGVKMYDVKSETGNISWDGKNLSGKEVPEGTYFYILKATGADGKTEWTNSKGEKIEQKGTISLYR